MKEKIELKINLPVPVPTLFNAWLNSKEHSAFTGGKAKISNKLNSKYTTWDGYISGLTLEIEENKRILQTWRSSDFKNEDEDSLLELKFKANSNGGTTLTLIHTNIPEGEGENYKKGWKDFYFTPMKEYFKD